MSSRPLKLLLVLTGALLLAPVGCLTPDVPDTGLPSWVMDKRFLDDGQTWWMARTVISIQADQGLAYPGDGDVNDQIRFKIERDFVYVVRAVALLSGEGPNVSGTDDAENIVAAYPILQHFDVINGQMVVPPNKEWWELTHMRVDWARNAIPEYRFLALLGNQVAGTSYMVEDAADTNAPIWPSLEDPNYLDFTTHMLLSPVYALNPFTTTPDFCGENAGYFWDYYNCAPVNLGFRTSFRKIPPDHQYEPLFNADPLRAPGWGAPSRFFKVSFLTITEPYGITTQDHHKAMSRVNIWRRSYDAEGNPLPYREREVAPVALHVSQDFPIEHLDEIDEALDEWDQVLREVVRDLRAWECRDDGGGKEDCLQEANDSLEPDVLLLCSNNPVVEGDPEACGPPGTRARLGDLRYHFLDWLTEDIPQAPAAVTWWSADLETGENINTHIKLTGGRVVRAAAFFRDAVLLAQDRVSTSSAFAAAAPSPSSLAHWRNQVASKPLPFAPRRPGGPVLQAVEPGVFELEEIATDSPALLETPAAFLGREALLQPVVGTQIEGALLDQEDSLVRHLLPEGPSATATPSWDVSPLREGYRAVAEMPAATRAWYAERGVDMEIPFEVDIRYYSKLFEDLTPDEIYDEFKARNVKNFFLHEVGHMLGMRHNFAGSFDAINYRDEYWQLRRDDCVGSPRYVEGCELTEEESEQGANQYAYSSVLDYMPRSVSSDPGLGYYDKAAMYALYGKMVPVFEDESLADNEEAGKLLEGLYGRSFVGFPLYWEEDASAPNGYRPRSWHYTRFPGILGDLSAREYVPTRHLDAATNARKDVFGRYTVPFLSCEDSTRGVEPYCMYFDSGADPFEIAQTYTSWFRTFYPLNNFRRGRLDWFPGGTLEDVTDRVFTPTKVWNDWYITFLHDFREYPEVFQDDDFLRPHQEAAKLNFNFLVETLATPEAGDHERVLLPDGEQVYRTWEEAVSYFPPPGWGTADISVPMPAGKEYRSALFLDGTNFYLNNIGSFAEKELALESLLDPAYFWFPGRDTWGTIELWQTNYYNTFPYPLLDVLGAIVVGDTERIAPRWQGGDVVFRDFTDLTSTVEGTPVAPAIGFNLRIRALVYGVGLVYSGYSDRTLLDYARVWEVGSGEEIATDNPIVTFSDPRTSKQYGAISYIHDGVELGIGARLILRGAELAQGWADAALAGEPEETLEWFEQELRRIADLIDISRTIVGRFEEAGYDGP